jgi:hypothetical protein
MTLHFLGTDFESRAVTSAQMADAASDRVMAEIERQHVTNDQTGCPSALHLATAAIRRSYILPETMQHPVVQFECTNLALLIMALGLAPTAGPCRVANEKRVLVVPPNIKTQFAIDS